MTIRYEYKCSTCGHEYVEQREENDPQFFTSCNSCNNGKYELVAETPIAD
jgi:peptide subunit release factor 1 (eRF1)